MQKNRLTHPVVVYMYGLPGSGKSYVARQISELLGMVHISSDRLRSELFENPKHDKPENQTITHLMNYMSEEFLKAGISVVYDISVSRLRDRRALRELAHHCGARELMVWLQIDSETAKHRSNNRDHRKIDDKYSTAINDEIFDRYAKALQNPQNESYLVLSGKHVFNTQKTAILRRLQELSLLNQELISQKIAKPEMINLISRAQAQADRIDYTKRNIVIR